MHLSQLSSAQGRVHTAASLLQPQDQQLHPSQLFIQQRHLSQLSPEGSLVSGPHFRCRHFEIQYFSLILLHLMYGLLKGPLEPIIVLNYLKIHILLKFF
jgi:hypothetical protein